MFEKVNPSHPDKLADRIAGALVDAAYKDQANPKVAIEILLGHEECSIIAETSVSLYDHVPGIVKRIAGDHTTYNYLEVPQDAELSKNQKDGIRCGDNGIFLGMPLTEEQKTLSAIARDIYAQVPHDGKYILAGDQLIVCQSNIGTDLLRSALPEEYRETAVVNPLGFWTGGINVDTGAVNRKLGSDMADSVTGGGLHGKDLSKADVAVNIYAWLKAQKTGKRVELYCAIGDSEVDGRPYEEIVEVARGFITELGGFEKLAEWGLF